MTGRGVLIKQTLIAIIVGSVIGWSGGFAVKTVPVNAFSVNITIADGAEILEVVPIDPGFTPVVTSVLVEPGKPVKLVTLGGDITVEVEAGTVDYNSGLRFESLPAAEMPDLPPRFELVVSGKFLGLQRLETQHVPQVNGSVVTGDDNLANGIGVRRNTVREDHSCRHRQCLGARDGVVT